MCYLGSTPAAWMCHLMQWLLLWSCASRPSSLSWWLRQTPPSTVKVLCGFIGRTAVPAFWRCHELLTSWVWLSTMLRYSCTSSNSHRVAGCVHEYFNKMDSLLTMSTALWHGQIKDCKLSLTSACLLLSTAIHQHGCQCLMHIVSAIIRHTSTHS